jgi:two-component system chemotaxis response regulator CheY
MKVLIVDDDPDICVMMRALLRAQGWETEELTSGKEALARVDELLGFDAVVLDHRMPGVTGIEVARNLRDEGVSRPLIMCSAYLTPEIEEEAKRLNMPTVSKADLNRLVDTIRQHVGVD